MPYALVITFLASYVFIRMLIHYAPRLGLVDVPNERSIHTDTVPRGAGIGIFLAMIASCYVYDYAFVNAYPLTFAAMLMVFAIGILDDHKDAGPRMKFIVIFVATTLAYFDGIGIHSLGGFFGQELALGWLALPFTLFAVSGFTNAFNLVDGLDGLAGTIGLIILAMLINIGMMHDDRFIVTVGSILGAAILAFLWLNWNPAKVFMGDSGSLTIGFIISLLSIKALDYIQPTLILFLAAIPIFDTLIVMVRRKRRGHSAFKADKTHLHHILLAFFNGNVIRTVITLGFMQIIYSVSGLLFISDVDQTLILMLFLVNLVMFYIIASTMLDNQDRIEALEKKLKK